MIWFLFQTPIIGSFSLPLLGIVTFLLWQLFFTRENVPKTDDEATKSVLKVPKPLTDTQLTTKIKKCGGKLDCCSKKVKLIKKVLYIYSSSDKSKIFSKSLKERFEASEFEANILNLETPFDVETVLLPQTNGATIFVVDSGVLPDWFHSWLRSQSDAEDAVKLLAGLKFAVFGIGGTSKAAHDYDRCLGELGGRRIKNVNASASEETLDADFKTWMDELALKLVPKKTGCICGPKNKKQVGGCSSGESSSCDSSDGEETGTKQVVDVEDLLLPARRK